jgi:CheY-like chemotaxis protein
MVEKEKKFILALITDLFFGMRVRNTAEQLGYALKLIENGSEIGDSASFSAQLDKVRPSFIILDIHSALPWKDWMKSVKEDEKLRDIPWLAFGSHVSSDLLAEAKQLGADKVIAKSKFTEDLPTLMQSLAGE